MTFEAASLKRNIALGISEYHYCHSFTQKYLLNAKYYADDTYNGDQETCPALWEKSWNFPSSRKD